MPHRVQGEVWNQAVKNGVLACFVLEIWGKWRGWMGKSVLPEIYAEPLTFKLMDQAKRIGEALRRPHEAARISVALPSRFQADDIAGDALLAKAARQVGDGFGIGPGVAAIPHAQAPHGRHGAATAEEVVPADGVHHGGTGEEIYVHTARCRYLNTQHAGVLHRGVQGVHRTVLDLALAGERFSGPPMRCHAERRIAGGVDGDRPTCCGDQQGDRRVRIASVGHRVGIDAQRLLQPRLAVRSELQPQAIKVLTVADAQLQNQAALRLAIGKRCRYSGRLHLWHLLQSADLRRGLAETTGNERFRHAHRHPPDAWSYVY